MSEFVLSWFHRRMELLWSHQASAALRAAAALPRNHRWARIVHHPLQPDRRHQGTAARFGGRDAGGHRGTLRVARSRVSPPEQGPPAHTADFSVNSLHVASSALLIRFSRAADSRIHAIEAGAIARIWG